MPHISAVFALASAVPDQRYVLCKSKNEASWLARTLPPKHEVGHTYLRMSVKITRKRGAYPLMVYPYIVLMAYPMQGNYVVLAKLRSNPELARSLGLRKGNYVVLNGVSRT